MDKQIELIQKGDTVTRLLPVTSSECVLDIIEKIHFHSSPKTQLIAVSCPANNSTIVAPGNGYICLTQLSKAEGNWLRLCRADIRNGMGQSVFARYANQTLQVTIPCTKNENIKISWTDANTNEKTLYFIPLNN